MFLEPTRGALENRLRGALLTLDARLNPPTPGPVTILAIDEEAIDMLGTWPWPRAVWAELIARIRQAHAPNLLGIDAVFPPAPEQTAGNAAFAAALARQPSVVGQLMLHDPGTRGARPWQPIAPPRPANFPPPDTPVFKGALGSEAVLAQSARVGHINALIDTDGVMRRAPTLVCDGPPPAACAPSLLQSLVAQLTGVGEWSVRRGGWNEASWMLVPGDLDSLALPVDDSLALTIPWRSSAALRYASVARAWAGELPAGTLDQGIVLIGGVSLGLGDYVVSAFYDTVPGVEVHAHTLQAWLGGQVPYEPRYAAYLMNALALVTAALLLANARRFRRLAAITAAGVILPVAGALVAWRADHVLWPAAAPATFAAFAGAVLLLSQVLHERTRLRERFEAYLPPPLRRLIDRPDAVVPTETGWGTVMVADILGYTAQSQRLPLGDLARWCDSGIAHVVGHAKAHGAMLDNVAGDGALLLWRTGTDVEQAQAACDAARAILEGMSALNASLAEQGLPPLSIGIGMHAGPYLLGSFGTDQKRYTVVSEVANLAAHIERQTRHHPWPLLLSKTVAQALPANATLPVGDMPGEIQRTMALFTLADVPANRWQGRRSADPT